MKIWGKIIYLALGIMIFQGGSLLFAASNPSEISLYLNNVFQKNPGIAIEEKVFVPVEEWSENVFALSSFNKSEGTMQLYKPNVNLVLLDEEGQIFGKVKSDSRIKFTTLIQVDNLKTKISDLEIIITDPMGITENISAPDIEEITDHFWFKSEEFTFNFKQKGIYSVRVNFKEITSNKFSPVAEIQIISI